MGEEHCPVAGFVVLVWEGESAGDLGIEDRVGGKSSKKKILIADWQPIILGVCVNGLVLGQNDH